MPAMLRDLSPLPLGLIAAGTIFVGATLWSTHALDAEADRIAEANMRLAPVARFVITGSDGFNPMELDRESGCLYRVIDNGLAGYRRMEYLRSDGKPDCDPARIVPGIAERRAAVQYQLQTEGVLNE